MAHITYNKDGSTKRQNPQDDLQLTKEEEASIERYVISMGLDPDRTWIPYQEALNILAFQKKQEEAMAKMFWGINPTDSEKP